MKCSTLRFRTHRPAHAAAALSSILVVGIIVVEAAIAALVVSYLVGQQGLGLRRATQALTAARAGLDDAMLKIVRNKSFSPASPYALAIGDISVSVLVCRELMASTTAYTACHTTSLPSKYEIVSTATAVNKKSRLKAVLVFDTASGLVTVESVQEIAAN